MQVAIVFAITLAGFVLLDAAWLVLVAGDFFKHQLGSLLREVPNLAAAGAFYLIYAVGLLVFVVHPALRVFSARQAAANGALFGLAAYATFDLTNLAILQGWTVTVALIDMAWGAFGTSLACLGGYLAGRRFDR